MPVATSAMAATVPVSESNCSSDIPLPRDRGRKEFPKRIPIWRMEEHHGLLRLCLSIDRACMTEGAEPRLATVGPHAGCADATVGHVFHEHMRHHIIDRYTTRCGAVEYPPSPLIVRAEIVESEWRRA